ncbi:MAG TPA: hypothetical protein VFH51_13900, partial [Myxococcota bacterium]|nr:hypothetical protein [Myxococcota bacterium]
MQVIQQTLRNVPASADAWRAAVVDLWEHVGPEALSSLRDVCIALSKKWLTRGLAGVPTSIATLSYPEALRDTDALRCLPEEALGNCELWLGWRAWAPDRDVIEAIPATLRAVGRAYVVDAFFALSGPAETGRHSSLYAALQSQGVGVSRDRYGVTMDADRLAPAMHAFGGAVKRVLSGDNSHIQLFAALFADCRVDDARLALFNRAVTSLGSANCELLRDVVALPGDHPDVVAQAYAALAGAVAATEPTALPALAPHLGPAVRALIEAMQPRGAEWLTHEAWLTADGWHEVQDLAMLLKGLAPMV